MRRLNIEQLELALTQMKHLKIQHPKANILLDMDTGGVIVSHPLPQDFWEINKIEFSEKHI